MAVRPSWNLGSAAFVSVLAFQACRSVPTDTQDAERTTTPVLAGGSRQYTQVVAGFVHTCAIASDGSAFCWGGNEYSQLGSDAAADACGGRPCSKTPVAVAGDLRFTSLAAGWVHNCGITPDRTAYCWGGGASGVTSKEGYLGDGSLRRSSVPVRVLADSAFVSLTIGDGHTCALTASGRAYCWGQNTFGQVGDGTNVDRATPIRVRTELRFNRLSAGAYHTCGITQSNETYCWGDNRWGQLGSGDVEYNAVSSSRNVPTPVSGDLKFTAIAAGWEHSCALAQSGTTYCWGRNEDAKQLGDDSGITHRGVPGPIAGSFEFTELAAGALSTCGRTATNEVYCWGGDYYGGLGNGEIVSAGVGHPVRTLGGPFSQVTIGQSHACAVATDRRLWCWGDQSVGQF
jgi:alpha-tubulin suppressor-like RCC1 family protein